MNKFNIAIDGPAGAGKSTAARLVAEALGFVYVDTGAMYRAVTLSIIQQGLVSASTEEMVAAANRLDIRLVPGKEGQLVYADGVDVTGAIRSGEVTSHVSRISSIADIRRILTAKQKEMARDKGVVMDGRDIGTEVLPDAEIKVFLTAGVRVRAERRYRELAGIRTDVTIETLEREIAERDRMDEQRDVSPLRKAPDAVLIDATSLDIPEVVERILDLCRARVSGGD